MTDQEESKPGRALWLGDFMEYGQNLALATALVAFSGFAFYIEPVSGSDDWHKKLAGFCMVGAVIWALASALRFTDGLAEHTRLRRGSLLDYLVTAVVVVFSLLACGLGFSVPDNNHIVKICERFEDEPSDKIHRSDECQRLYEQRRDYERQLRGE